MNEIESFVAVTTTIYLAELAPTARSERRRAEKEAVGRLVEAAFGEGTKLSHRLDGAPFVEGSDINISVSHGGGLALLAVDAEQPIGVDVECWRQGLVNVAPRVLSPEELESCSSDRYQLLRAWTAKEAIFKAAGVASLTLPQISLPGSVGERDFDVEFFERGEAVIALAREKNG